MHKKHTTMIFDKKAKDWDKDQARIARAKVFAKKITDFIKHNNGEMHALEFGCGTGLLSFAMKDRFKTITLIDVSPSMIDVLKGKIKSQNIINMRPILIDLFKQRIRKKHFDIVYTLMTLHHITAIEEISKILVSLVKPGGYLCIADTITEDGSLHYDSPDFEGHNGFDREELKSMFLRFGMQEVFYEITYVLEKKVKDEIRQYPLFLMILQRKKQDNE